MKTPKNLKKHDNGARFTDLKNLQNGGKNGKKPSVLEGQTLQTGGKMKKRHKDIIKNYTKNKILFDF